jgi:type VI secretion system protein ImpC
MANKTSAEGAVSTTEKTVELDDFEKLLDKNFGISSDPQRERVVSAVQTLAQQALSETALISKDAYDSIQAIIAELDKKMSEQLNLILHHEEFKTLEGSWRGLHHLVTHTETDEMLKIRVLNVSKKEVARTLKKFKGTAWDQSPLFKKIYGEEYDMPGGSPYGCLIGDYYFDHTAPDVGVLEGMAQIAASCHCPFIAGAAPSLMMMQSWQELNNPRDLTKIFETPDYAPWKSLRESEDSRYIGLGMPRFLSRLPYGAKTNPVDDFAFEEDAEGGDHSKYVWSNAAYAMGANITNAFKQFGWCARIRGKESGGIAEGLPCHTFPTDDGGVDMKCPTEIGIGDRREKELAKNGLMPLSHYKNTDYAVFMGAQSLQKPQQYYEADATANANLSARLPYLFAACRFAHYLKCMVRDKIGSYMERGDMENWLNKWIQNYVVANPQDAGEETKAKKPLAAANAVVEEVEGDPGAYSAKFFLRPHYQLESLNVSLRLVARLPSKKQ